MAQSLRFVRTVANRILVVDDEKSILFALEKYFEQHGFAVDTAANASQALELIEQNTYDLAIIDIHLSGRLDLAEGLEIAALLRDSSPDTAVIVMTALGTPETERRAAEVGAHSFLRKPTRLAHVADIAFALIGTPVAIV
jgi:DNA-binding response OmpR family regulator